MKTILYGTLMYLNMRVVTHLSFFFSFLIRLIQQFIWDRWHEMFVWENNNILKFLLDTVPAQYSGHVNA